MHFENWQHEMAQELQEKGMGAKNIVSAFMLNRLVARVESLIFKEKFPQGGLYKGI